MTKSSAKAICYFLSLYIVSNYVPAVLSQSTQTTGSVRGQVVSEKDGEEIPDATVRVVNQDIHYSQTSRTQLNGEYRMTLLPPGRYAISTTCAGYVADLDSSTRNFVIKLKPNTVRLPRLTLRPTSAMTLPTIVDSTKLGQGAFLAKPGDVIGTDQLHIRRTSDEGYGLDGPLNPMLVKTQNRETASEHRQQSPTGKADNQNKVPQPPEINPIAEGDKQVTGRATPAATVWLYRNNKTNMSSAVADSNGDFIVRLNRPIALCDEVWVKQTVSNKDSDLTAVVVSSSSSPDLLDCESSAEQLVNTTNATRGGNFNRRQLTYLPLSGFRSFDDLALLLPGVAPAPQAIGETAGPGIAPGVGTSGQYSVNGLRGSLNNFTVDGSDNNDHDVGGRRQGFTSLVPHSIESMQEFQITTLLPEPQFGRNMGAQANAVSRSGGVNYHGTLYGFFTDSHLKARDFFDQTGGPPSFAIRRASDGAPVLLDGQPLQRANPVGGEDPFTRLQSGFVFGGPIIKPKTLFSLSFEHKDLNASKESHFAVPTVEERGLFGTGATGINTLGTGKPGKKQLFPAHPTSKTGDAFFSLFPFPNNPTGPYGDNTFTEVLPADADGTIFSIRLTQQNFRAFKSDNTLTGKYHFTDDDTTLPVTGGALFSTLRALVRTQNVSSVLDSIISSRAANQARFSYGRINLKFKEVRDPLLLSSDMLPDVPFLLNARNVSNITLPGTGPQFITGSGPAAHTEAITRPLGQVKVSGFSPLGADAFSFPQGGTDSTFQFADTLFLEFGERHGLTAGFDIRRNHLNSFLDRNFRPLAVFNGTPNISKHIGVENARPLFQGTDLVAAGAPTAFLQTLKLVSDSTIELRNWENDYFIADQIRLRNLTLTVGLRYELNTVPTDANRRIESNFVSPEIDQLIRIEKARAMGAKAPATSGFEQFFAGRSKIFSADHNNFAPHFAFAWDPFSKGRMAIRGGYGVYYDQIVDSVASQSRTQLPSFISLNLAGLTILGPDLEFLAFNPHMYATPGTLNDFDKARLGKLVPFLDKSGFLDTPIWQCPVDQTNPIDPAVPARDLVTPYSQHWGLTIEGELGRDYLFSIAYVGTRGTHLLRQTTPNLGKGVVPIVTSITSGDASGGLMVQGFAAEPGLMSGGMCGRPFHFVGALTLIESGASSTYHGLQFHLTKRFSNRVELSAAYTWSHAIDDVSDLFDLAGAPALPQNSFNLRAERGDASFDVRHRLVFSFIWDLPRFSSSTLLAGWQIASIGTFQTGQPFTMLACCDINLDGNLTDRLNVSEGIRKVDKGAVRLELPPDPLSLQASLTKDGAVGRNTFRAPGIATIDLAINKDFKLGERQRLEMRVECFNIFNRTHFGIPVHQVGPGVGRSVDTRLPARTIQFALKYSF
jgi:Carboxypeptidase regulatory-like domain/Bacterial Ig domain